MATTSAGNPYVESSDLVANYPATSLALANRLDKYAVNPFADAAARDAAIPTPVQGQLAQTLDDNKVWRYDGTAWAPFSGAVGAANFTDTATGTFSSGGINYKYITYTGTGSITIDQEGFADILLVSGGGSGGAGFGSGGGGGAFVDIYQGFLSVATHTVVVGAGGAGQAIPATSGSSNGNNGNSSRVSVYFSPGGGGGIGANPGSSSFYPAEGLNGGSGGGASGGLVAAGASGGTGVAGFGGDGGLVAVGILRAAAGGGGSATGIPGRGLPPSANDAGGDGGAGRVSTIRNTSVYLAAGGGGGGGATAGAED